MASWSLVKWAPGQNIVVPNTGLFASLNNLNQREFKVCVLRYPPFQTLLCCAPGRNPFPCQTKEDTECPQQGSPSYWMGFVFEMMNELAASMNFTYQVVYGEGWGKVDSNGVWNGMLGQMNRGECDFSPAAFSITESRASAFDFANPFYSETYTIVQPRASQKSRPFFYVEPFEVNVWILIICTVALMGPLAWLINGWTPYYKCYPDTMTSSSVPLFHIQNCCWYVYGAFCQQGGIWLPGSPSARILIGLWWFFTIIVVAVFSGNLIAFLTFPKTELLFIDFNSVVDQTSVGWGSLTNVAFHQAMEDAFKHGESDTIYYKLWAGIRENIDTLMMENSTDGFNRVSTSDYVFMEERTVAEQIMSDRYKETGRCDYSINNQINDIFTVNLGMALPNNSLLTPYFSKRILKMIGAGLDSKWIQAYWPKNNKCVGSQEEGTAKKVSLDDFMGAFYAYIALIAFAIVVLLAEVIFYFIIGRVKEKKRGITAGGLYGFSAWYDPQPPNAKFLERMIQAQLNSELQHTIVPPPAPVETTTRGTDRSTTRGQGKKSRTKQGEIEAGSRMMRMARSAGLWRRPSSKPHKATKNNSNNVNDERKYGNIFTSNSSLHDYY